MNLDKFGGHPWIQCFWLLLYHKIYYLQVESDSTEDPPLPEVGRELIKSVSSNESPGSSDSEDLKHLLAPRQATLPTPEGDLQGDERHRIVHLVKPKEVKHRCQAS